MIKAPTVTILRSNSYDLCALKQFLSSEILFFSPSFFFLSGPGELNRTGGGRGTGKPVTVDLVTDKGANGLVAV